MPQMLSSILQELFQLKLEMALLQMKFKDIQQLKLKLRTPAPQPGVFSIIIHCLLKILRRPNGLNLAALGSEERRREE